MGIYCGSIENYTWNGDYGLGRSPILAVVASYCWHGCVSFNAYMHQILCYLNVCHRMSCYDAIVQGA
jgi:hypothetical protein